MPELTNFLKVSIDVSYFICISPHRLIETPDFQNLKHFKVKSWLPQKLLCGLFISLDLLWIIWELRKSIPHNDMDPAEYFLFAYFALNGIFLILAWKFLWFSFSKDILPILNSLVNYEATNKNLFNQAQGAFIPRRNRVYLICVGRVVIALLLGLSGMSLVPLELDQDNQDYQLNYGEQWLKQLLQTSRIVFFIQNGTTVDCFGETVMTVVSGLSYFHRRLLSFYGPTIIFMVAATLWMPVRNFTKSVAKQTNSLIEEDDVLTVVDKKVSTLRLDTIQRHIETLEDLAEVINTSFGSRLGFYFLTIVVYYSTRLDRIFSTSVDSNLLETLQICFWFLAYLPNALIFLYMAGDVCHQVWNCITDIILKYFMSADLICKT